VVVKVIGSMAMMAAQQDLRADLIRENNALREALRKIAEGTAPADPHGHYLAHREAVRIAREALATPNKEA
jgi:hypothetical protein